MDLSLYIHSEYYLLVIILYLIGGYIKSITNINNKYIPILLPIIGMICVCIISLIDGVRITSDILFQGIICGLTAVGGNQIYKQTIKKSENFKIKDITEKDETIPDEIDCDEEIDEDIPDEQCEDDIIDEEIHNEEDHKDKKIKIFVDGEEV